MLPYLYTVTTAGKLVYSGGDYDKASAIYEKHLRISVFENNGEFVQLRRIEDGKTV